MAAFNRRSILLGGLAAAACARMPVYTQAAEPGLRDLASANGIDYGSMVTWKSWDGNNAIDRDDGFSQLVQHECGIVVTAMEIFWRVNSKSPGAFDFGGADEMVEWAAAHGEKIRAHNLIWQEETPEWYERIDDRAYAEKMLIEHVTGLCGRYAGKIHSWDVANEVLAPGDDRPDGLRKTVFLEKLGPEYLYLAFRAAREADPKALLVCNDYGFEYDIDSHEAKRRAMLGLIDGFKQRGTPIDAVGIQSHLSVERMSSFNDKVFANFLKEIADRGLQVMITELDVVDRGAPADIAARDAAVAAVYRQYLAVALDSPAVKTVITWGLVDRDSWITHYNMDEFRRDDGLPPRPLPFDDDLKPKPAYAAMAEAFRAARKR
jgi:endo-1,4-beta-xylanase